MAYTVCLFVHSYLRWVVLALGLATLVRSVGGWRAGSPYAAADNRVSVAFMSALDLQMVLGVLLYALLSPITAAFFANPKAGMKDATLRFFGVEHIIAMLIGLVLVHAGRAIGKRRVNGARHRLIAVTTTIWLLLTLASVPWPGFVYARALFRTL